MRARLTVLGSGTSMGVPTVGCRCEVCRSTDPLDRRLRPSILLEYEGRTVLIDSSPDFREQALRAGVRRIDAVLYTHGHADHIFGLDDLRPLTFPAVTGGPKVPLYANPATAAVLRHVFDYIFEDSYKYGGLAQVELHEIDTPFQLFGVTFEPLTVMHGDAPIFGYRFGKAAYLTDFSAVPPETMARLDGLEVLFLDALRHTPHPTHSTVANSLEIAARLKPQLTCFTHISHGLPHRATQAALPDGVRLAYDGMQLDFEIATAAGK
jgi:phosphoribosyl 1,2-cyclic phosphate phosphodiesterase